MTTQATTFQEQRVFKTMPLTIIKGALKTLFNNGPGLAYTRVLNSEPATENIAFKVAEVIDRPVSGLKEESASDAKMFDFHPFVGENYPTFVSLERSPTAEEVFYIENEKRFTRGQDKLRVLLNKDGSKTLYSLFNTELSNEFIRNKLAAQEWETSYKTIEPDYWLSGKIY